MFKKNKQDTVTVPNPWEVADGQPFTLPRNPDMSHVFATTDSKERYIIFFSYLYHPEVEVRLATLQEAIKLGVHPGQNQAIVDKLGDPDGRVREAAAQLVVTSSMATEFALECLKDEIDPAGPWTISTMGADRAKEAVSLLRAAVPSDMKDEFEEMVAYIIEG